MPSKYVHLICLYSLVCLLFVLACQESSKLPDEEVKKTELKERHFFELVDSTCLIGNVVLDVESVSGLIVRPAEYEWLADLLEEADSVIVRQKQYTKKEAISILKQLDQLIRARRTRQATYHGSFAMCIRFGIFDCDINSLLYLHIAEYLELPIRPILMPSHMAVLWQGVTDTIYWETTEGRERSLSYYLQRFSIDQQAMEQAMLFRPLRRDQMLAVIFYNIGSTFAETHNYDLAISYMRHAYQLEKKWFKPYTGLAYVYQQKGLAENALYYSNQSLRLLKQDDLLKVKAEAYEELGCNTEAIEEYAAFLETIPIYQYEREKTIRQIREKMTHLE